MRHVLFAVGLALTLGVGAQDRDYVVYKVTAKEPYHYRFQGGTWLLWPVTYLGYFVAETTLTKGTELSRVVEFLYWQESSGAYYDWWPTDWFRLLQFGTGQQAIVGCSAWKPLGGVEVEVLVGASAGGAPKSYVGAYLYVEPGSELSREDVKMRLDTKLTAAARAAAAAATGDPLVAAREVVAASLEMRGYQEDR
jgi:hypothetical protein